MQALSTQQQYENCCATFRLWVNWSKPTDAIGLLLGFGDYYFEITLLEEELNIPIEKRFKLPDYKTW